MDCQMPEMDGYEATRLIRSHKTEVINPDITIIAMTANAMVGDREKSIEAGMNDYISKPIERDILAKKLDRWLVTPFIDRTKDQIEDNIFINILANESVSAIFNEKILLDQFENERVLVQQVLFTFVEDVSNQIHHMKELINKQDITGVWNIAHRIKGGASQITAFRLHDIAKEIEKAGKKGDLNMVSIMIPELEKQFELLKSILMQSKWN
jgi:response regulator RpfG family c-di-GMP phosphodiesterase